MPTSVRLDRETESLLRRLAQRYAASRSQIIRRAIARLAREEGLHDEPLRPYDLVQDLVGCAKGGPPDLSEETGRRFAEGLTAQRESSG